MASYTEKLEKYCRCNGKLTNWKIYSVTETIPHGSKLFWKVTNDIDRIDLPILKAVKDKQLGICWKVVYSGILPKYVRAFVEQYFAQWFRPMLFSS